MIKRRKGRPKDEQMLESQKRFGQSVLLCMLLLGPSDYMYLTCVGFWYLKIFFRHTIPQNEQKGVNQAIYPKKRNTKGGTICLILISISGQKHILKIARSLG